MSLPTVTATGRLTRDPETRFLQNGNAVANFSIACNDRRKNQQTGEWEDGDTTFLDVSAWRKLAEYASDKLRKGQLVTVVGKLSSRTYDAQDGSKRTAFQVTAEEIGISIFNRDDSAPAQGGWGQQQAAPQADPWGNQSTQAPF